MTPGDRTDDPERTPTNATAELEQARGEIGRLSAENDRLRSLLGLMPRDAAVAEPPPDYSLAHELEDVPEVNARSTLEAKIGLFRSRFRGRDDVFALRWESARSGKSGYSPAVPGGWAGPKGSKEYLPLTDEVIEEHLLGNQTVGIYPLLLNDTCWFLACDFDGETWPLDALASLDVCRLHGVPGAIERSRSGAGAHVWIFFSAPVRAAEARRLGTGLLRDTMFVRAEMDLASYDRFFPSQDFVPKGSFGNLIALPLQGTSRQKENTEFLDPGTLEPWPDQWAFLSSIACLSPRQVEIIAAKLRPVVAGPGSSASFAPARSEPAPPERMACTIGAMVSVERAGLPP